MANFNLDDYEPVDSRLKKAFADHPDMSVVTKILSPIEEIDNLAVIMATLTWGELVYTGIAHERHDAGYVNKTSHVENCETSAIGRALANAGYSGDKRASREEMDKVNRSSAAQNQAEHFQDKEAKARQKAKDMINDNRGILGDDAALAYEVDLADAKGYDAVVTVGKELKADIQRLTDGPPKTKEEKAREMGGA